MKNKNFNVLQAFKKVFGKNIKLETTFEDLSLDNANPFEYIASESLGSHVDQFLKERKNEDLQKFWQDEIKLNGGK